MNRLSSFLLACLLVLAPVSGHAAPEDVLLEADRAFAAKAKEIGVGPAFVQYAESPTIMLNLVRVQAGPADLLEAFPDGTLIDWAPEQGMIAASGDLGFTWGKAVYTVKGADGANTQFRTRYVTVWRKQADGGWKFVLDAGIRVPPGAAD